MRKQVEALKHHPDIRADCLNILEIARQIGAMHIDEALLVFFQPVDAADQC